MNDTRTEPKSEPEARQNNELFNYELSFADMGVRQSVLQGLEAAGFKHPTDIQAKLIPVLMDERDALGQARTGTGKTAAFGVPVLCKAEKDVAVQALVLAPTRELSAQVAQELNELGKFTPINAVSITGGESYKQQTDAIKRGVQIVVGTPGRIIDLMNRRQLPLDNIRFAILDEVDRMLDIGFRDDIRKILDRVKTRHQTVMVSATISEEIERLGRKYMRDDAEKIIAVTDRLTVSEVDQKYVPVAPWDKRRLLVHLLNTEDPALTVVFCRMKRTVRDVARYIRDHKIDATEIHGDLPQRKRTQVIERMRKGKLEVLVASDLASRGLDIENITHIINYDIPEDPEQYVHRVGRTARAGREGTAWTFVTPEEGQLLTEIEKFAAVHLERLEYRDFEPSDPPKKYKAEKEAERKRKEETHRSRYDTAVSSTEKSEDADQGAFPSGVVPKGPPRKTLGSRLRTRRGKR